MKLYGQHTFRGVVRFRLLFLTTKYLEEFRPESGVAAVACKILSQILSTSVCVFDKMKYKLCSDHETVYGPVQPRRDP